MIVTIGCGLTVADSSIVIPLQGYDYLYGNDVELRSNCTCKSTTTPATFIEYNRNLAAGRLLYFFVYVHPTTAPANVTIRLQIWRMKAGSQQPTDGFSLKLAWELSVTLETGPNGTLYTVNDIRGCLLL